MVYCDICKQVPASLHITRIEGGQVYEIHYCQKCAEAQTNLKPNMSDLEIVEEIFKEVAAKVADTGTPIGSIKEGMICPSCGMKMTQFYKTAKLGCPECYNAFKNGREGIRSILRKIHGNNHHVGKTPNVPTDIVEREKRIRELDAELAAAVKLENYEKAAELRDQIKKLGGIR